MIKKLLILILLVFLIASSIALWYWNDYKTSLTQAVNFSEPEHIILIKKGDLTRHIATHLYSLNIIKNAEYFRLYARLSKKASKIKAGEYAIKPEMTLVDIVDLLVSGKVVHYSFTIVEGWTVKEALEAIKTNHNLSHSEDEFYNEVLTNYLKSDHISLEGLLYPDTYHFPRGTSDFQFIKRSYDQLQTVLKEEWHNREKETPLKTPYEALILASIVERESGVSSERSKIAGVFIRRLNKKMRLQSDPTIIYGMGDRYKGNIRRKDINEKTAYNTYQIKRLPPTPIAIAGREAIHAVLHPDKGKSLYFVADGSGGHYFSKTLKEHNRAVRQYILKKK